MTKYVANPSAPNLYFCTVRGAFYLNDATQEQLKFLLEKGTEVNGEKVVLLQQTKKGKDNEPGEQPILDNSTATPAEGDSGHEGS